MEVLLRMALTNALSASMLALYSVPVFWLGLVFILFFAVHAQWLPSSGMMNFSYGRPADPWDIARHLVLPLSVLVLHSLPIYARITRESVIEAAQDDSVITARAIGYPTAPCSAASRCATRCCQ